MAQWNTKKGGARKRLAAPLRRSTACRVVPSEGIQSMKMWSRGKGERKRRRRGQNHALAWWAAE